MLKKIFLGCMFLLFAASAHAANLAFLKDSVLTRLSPDDVASFRQLVLHSLQTVPDQEEVFWQGDSGVRGKLKPLFTYRFDERDCRRLRLAFISDKHKSESYKFDICQQGEGWRIADTPASHFSEQTWQHLKEEFIYALDEGADGYPVSWIDSSSDASGVIVPLNTLQRAGQTCRQVAVSLIDHKGRTSDGSYLFCQGEQGWARHEQSMAD